MIDQKKNEPTDFDLAQVAGTGNMVAFEELYQRHHRRVYSICIKMLRDEPEAEDLAQEVFVILFRKVGSFKGNSKFTTWLHRLTVNQVLMHFRKKTVKCEKIMDKESQYEEVVEKAAPKYFLPIVDRLTLEDAISKLPDGYRNVFTLHDVEGYEHEEVARILGISVGTSKSQLHKAKYKLRKLILAKVNPRLSEQQRAEYDAYIASLAPQSSRNAGIYFALFRQFSRPKNYATMTLMCIKM